MTTRLPRSAWVLFAAVAPAPCGCDIVFNAPPVSSAEATGFFSDIVGSSDSCSAFFGPLGPGFSFSFQNGDLSKSVGLVTDVEAPANVAVFADVLGFVSRPDSDCPYIISGNMRYERGPLEDAPAESQRVERFAPTTIHSAFFPAQELCTDPLFCARECGPTIPESRMVDVKLFCTASGEP